MDDFRYTRTFNQSNTTEMPLDDFLCFVPLVLAVPPLGLPANALVIRLLLGKPGICSTSEIFTLNLALFDILFCIIIPVEYLCFLFIKTGSTNFLSWGLNQAGGPMLLSLLSLDTYVAVCHPLIFHRLKDPKRRLSLCLVVSAVTAVCCGMSKISKSFSWSVLITLLCSGTTIISTCNILILKSLRQSGPSRKEVHPVKRRAFKMVLTAFVLVSIHYLSPLMEYVLRLFGLSNFRPFSQVTCTTYLVLSMSSFTQPLSYLVRTKQLPKMRCHCGPIAEAETGATVAS